ncbi:MAG: hypothetical protein RR356_01235, partial [Bacteroidales bacterium]
GRATQGVKLINLKEEDIIAAVTQVPRDEEEDEYNADDPIPSTENVEESNTNQDSEIENA